jgi:hypothetical protein
MKDWDKF